MLNPDLDSRTQLNTGMDPIRIRNRNTVFTGAGIRKFRNDNILLTCQNSLGRKTVIVILELVPLCRSQEAEASCLWCSCINGLRQGEARWRYETWVTALAALAGILAVIHVLAQGHNSSSPERLA
jgi:hypothetical protein